MAQSVKHMTLDFGSGNDPRVVGQSPVLGSALSMEPAYKSLCLPLPLSNSCMHVHMLSLSLSLSLSKKKVLIHDFNANISSSIVRMLIAIVIF